MHISEYLDKMPLCTYEKKEDRNLTVSLRSVSFIKYKDGVKGYRLWNPATRNTMYIRDVVFI